MSTVFMLSIGDEALDRYARVYFNRLSAAAHADRLKQHTLTDSPERADIILFVGYTFVDQHDVRSHPLVRRYPRKCFAFDSNDWTIPFLPGVYVNITKRWYVPERIAPGAYVHIMEYNYIPQIFSLDGCRHLFSFVGNSRSHRVRPKILALNDPRAYLQDTSLGAPAEQRNKEGFTPTYTDDTRQQYGRILSESKFVLAPRGYGPSSWRIFEAMRAGRVPRHHLGSMGRPKGPDWNSFSIRVAEREVTSIPRLLHHHESKAAMMGQLAHEAYEAWFSREMCFHRIVEWCLELRRQDRIPLSAYLQLLRPFYVRHGLLPRITWLKKIHQRLWSEN